LIEFRLLGLHLERIADIGLAVPEKSAHGSGTIEVMGISNKRNSDIDIDNVSFRYGEGESLILKEISLKIEPGEMISLVGTSGGGKTTLLKLLLGLFEPETGGIRYGGLPLDRYGLAQYRRKIGTVMQDDALLAGSIADNISFFESQPDFEKVRRCAEDAAIHADIVAMPMGYNSLVGEMGSVLSSGQRQRVLLARALYRDPEILVLDEGTANLDSATEANVVRMLEQLEITRICVAHREAMIRASARVILVQSGTLRELDKDQMFAVQGQQHASMAIQAMS